MKPSARKNMKLMKQYPFVKNIMAMTLEPLALTAHYWQVDDLTIRVQKADGELLYRTGNNTGLGDSRCLFRTNGLRQAGKCGEYLFAMDSGGGIINRVCWPRNTEEKRGQSPVYGFFALWGTRKNGMLSNPLWDKVEYLVWVSVYTWHDHSGDFDDPWGEFRNRTMSITIYSKPKCGFQELHEKANIYDHLYLTSQQLVEGAIRQNFDLITINGRLEELCTQFQDEVFFDGMKTVLYKGLVRGASGTFGSLKVLAAEMCGYDRVMLEDSSSWVSFQLRPGSERMCVLGCGGTLPQLRRLIRAAIEFWRNPENRTEFKADKEVSVL
jgi:hypothetical protein